MMHFGEVSTLGVMGTELGRPKVSFALDRKPVNDDPWFHTQGLVASLSFIGGLYEDKQHTLAPPFIPELNEFYARTMHFEYNKLRSESERIGLVIDADDTSDLPQCEIDFVWLIPRPYPGKTAVILGECKDRGGKGDKDTIDAKDIDNLKRVADALPRKRFETFIALVKLCPFTADEIALARTLNDPYRLRAILLTAQELEPYHFYERTKLEFTNIKPHASTPEHLATTTAEMYFK
jgi:hypothetical protein